MPDDGGLEYYAAGMELIGVTTLFLHALAHGMTVEATPTVIGQDGRACGQLTVVLVVEPRIDADGGVSEEKVVHVLFVLGGGGYHRKRYCPFFGGGGTGGGCPRRRS